MQRGFSRITPMSLMGAEGPVPIRRSRRTISARNSRISRGQFRRSMPTRRYRRSINSPMGIHQFIRNTNTNMQSIVSGTNGIINVMSASNGGFKIDNTVTSGTTLTWEFTLIQNTLRIYNSTGGTLTNTTYGVPSAAEFVTLFDNFRIDKIDVTCIFNKNVSTIQPDVNGQLGFPNILMCIDQDDNDYVSLENILQREDMVIWNLSRPRYEFSFKPKMNFLISNQAGTGIIGIGQLSKDNPFLDTNASQLSPHYGLKMVMDNPTGSTITLDAVLGQLSFTFKYHLSFKNVK